jgi:1,4-dihydroxy-2-naphthoate octaprenyltransferase
MGVDDPRSPGTKYRLVSGIIHRQKNILYLGIIAFGLAILFGIIAVYLSTIYLLIPGILGGACALFYSEWPFKFKYRALGEAVVFTGYGPLFGFACIFSLTQNFNYHDLLFSIPFGLVTLNVLLANNIRDYHFDIGKTKTLSTILGLKFSYTLLFFIGHLVYLFALILIYKNIIPKAGFITLIGYPLMILSINKIGTPKFINIFGMMQILYCLTTCLYLILFSF